MLCNTKIKNGFTLIEIIIAAVVLSLFLVGLFSLFSSGQKLGGQAFWIQNTINRLRFATRHISENFKQSSYPSTVLYPMKVIVNDSDDFKLHYTDRQTTYATQTVSVTSAGSLGTYLLQFPQSSPERQGGEMAIPASITYHIYSLSREGKLLYALYSESGITTTSPDYIQSISRSTIPPVGAIKVKYSVLAQNVESVEIFADSPSVNSAISISITCRYPKGETRRTERAIVVANIDNISHSAGSGSW